MNLSIPENLICLQVKFFILPVLDFSYLHYNPVCM